MKETVLGLNKDMNKKQIKILRWDEDKFILYTVKLYNKKR